MTKKYCLSLCCILCVMLTSQSIAADVQEETGPGNPYNPLPTDRVVVTKVKHFDNMCWRIAAAGGTWYFENGETQGKSGFSSAFDQAGNDWIGNDADKGFNQSPNTGGRHEYRGWPNFGEGNFDHPQRSSGAKTRWVDAQGNDIPFTGKLEGNHLIMRSANANYELEYHFFPTHAAIKVLKANNKYAFLYEGPIGGEQDASVEKDYYVLKDGQHRECKTGGLGYLEPEFGNKFPSPFFYLVDSDPQDPQVFYVGAKDVGPESAGDEGWRQGQNMVIFSFGRDQDKRAYTGTDAVCVFGFHRKAPHDQISNFIESRLAAPFDPAPTSSAASASKRLRVIMSSDFPPIGVVKGGNVPNNQKSDPDDMQSMVRFLLYANEFDIEGLIAGAGTFAMEAHKENILGVLDRYEMVYASLKSHDPAYPTADYLRSVTYEGLGNNHGLSIKWGSRTQPVNDIIGADLDSEASNAIIAAADKPDPRPLWIGVWGTPREVSQAIWRVRNDRSEEEFKTFISKLRIFLIAYQDCTHSWLMDEFPDLFIIDSRKTYQGFFGGGDPVSNLAWVNENIRNNHGPLCEVYPHEGMGCTGVCEGDSPTFMYLVSANRGINDPEDPTQPSWGGQYKRKANTNHYVDGPGGASISRWRKDYQKEFAERADWCVEATLAETPMAFMVTPKPTATPAATSTAAPATTPTAVFAVNCGGDAYTSSDGTEYAADTGYSGGSTFSNAESIAGTTDDTLYQSERYGDFTYAVEVPDGRYLVTLHFAETYHAEAGLRSFDVRMEGAESIGDLDLYAKAEGNTAYITQTYVTVSDGELNLEFATNVENAKINAIKVLPAGSATGITVFAVNCGGGAYTSSDGTDYVADTGYSGGSTYSNTESISETTDDTLYQSERYGDSTYSIAVPSGHYLVTLHFAETYHSAAGSRRFSVRMEGTEHVSDLDIYAKAGGNAAHITQTHVSVSDGELNIEFVTDVENAKINAIKVSLAESDAAFSISPDMPLAGQTASPPMRVFVQNTTPEPAAPPTPLKTRGPKGDRPRIINTTDLGADPDDQQSMVRFLVCSNEFDVEGLIVATGCWRKSQSNTDMLDKIVNAYAQVYDNLKVHADGYHTPEYLRSISVVGQQGYGMGDVGTGKDSPGSEMIIAAVDKDDPRPVWVTGWGGVNNVAQAIWKVQETRSEAELAEFISKLRVFDILGQDDAGAWLAKTFPDLFYIRATGVYGWQPPKNGSYQREDIQSHGPLGAVYPNTKWATEGDTPAFMHVYPNGLNDPDQIDQGGWGGRFSFTKKTNIKSMSGVKTEMRFAPYTMYGNTSEGAGAIKRWSDGYNNDFAARMDWTVTGDYSKANHHPVAVVNGDTTKQVLEVTASAGSSVVLSAAGSSDPDGDSLMYAWTFYKEPSSYSGNVSIHNSSAASTTVAIPSDAGGKTMHIVLQLHDDGSPNLYAYRRVIVNVQ